MAASVLLTPAAATFGARCSQGLLRPLLSSGSVSLGITRAAATSRDGSPARAFAPQIASPRGAALQLGSCKRATDPAGRGHPPRAALAVASLLCWVKVAIPSPATLEAVMWYLRSGFSLWGRGSRGLGTMHRGATHGRRKRRDERKKAKDLTKSAAQLWCWTCQRCPKSLPHFTCLCCGDVARWRRGGWPGHSWAGREVCVCESASAQLSLRF